MTLEIAGGYTKEGKKDRYKNWFRGEQVFITSREIKENG